ncbi:Maf family protein [Congregibacter sp.]|uniref:Maf family protein n=1 Tax=Congregibacter sp. TaxID=2744308 RepID=UPI003F6D85BB
MNQASNAQLVLASTSPYRRRLLERLQIPFSCVDSKTDETPEPGERPESLAQRLGDGKALAVATQYPEFFVLGSDQVASTAGQLLGKPGTVPAAENQLRLCSGQSVIFFTAVSLARGNKVIARRCVQTTVKFRHLSDSQVAEYVDRERPLDCAGSFRWEGLGICLFRALESSDPTALEGLPLIATCDILKDAGIYPL